MFIPAESRYREASPSLVQYQQDRQCRRFQSLIFRCRQSQLHIGRLRQIPMGHNRRQGGGCSIGSSWQTSLREIVRVLTIPMKCTSREREDKDYPINRKFTWCHILDSGVRDRERVKPLGKPSLRQT